MNAHDHRTPRLRRSLVVAALSLFALWPCGPGRCQPAAEPPSGGGDLFVAEIVDTVYTVGPAEFFALDLPADPPDAHAIYMSGTATVTDKKGDIMVRIFRAADYASWLKKRGGEKAAPIWTSKKSRNITIDQDLRQVGRCVLLLDNGYSMRTAKHVRVQRQVQYQRAGTTSGTTAVPAADPVDDFVIPRANVEEDVPPPPPPLPDGAH